MNKEQLLKQISEIIMNNVYDYGDWVDHETAAKQILDLIKEYKKWCI
jgi:hypothetical protein